jgi:hypothetical protein
VLVAHLLAPAGQSHSVPKNEHDDQVYFFAQYIVTNITVEVVKYNLLCHC